MGYEQDAHYASWALAVSAMDLTMQGGVLRDLGYL
jgi:hypothetical protein